MCPERITLLREYTQATAAYAEAVDQLQQRIGVSARGEYEKLRLISEGTRAAAEQARIRLEEHVSMHGCDGQGLRMSAGQPA